MRRLAFTLLAISIACQAYGQQWGDLSVRFVYDGEPPKPQEVQVDKDVAACGKKLPDESLLVNAKDGGIANVVMWLHATNSQDSPPIHPDLPRPAKEVVVTVRNCRIEPRVLLARPGQDLFSSNQDAVGHNLRGEFAEALGVIPAGRRELMAHLKKEDSGPIKIECFIHGWMHSWLFVRDSPYIAVSDASGKLAIPKLPTGKWTFRIWHERRGFIRQLVMGGATVELSRQGWSRKIKPGENDLGKILIKPAQLERN